MSNKSKLDNSELDVFKHDDAPTTKSYLPDGKEEFKDSDFSENENSYLLDKVNKESVKGAKKLNRTVKYRQELVDNDTILSVRNLKQFFFFGKGPNRAKLKAVANVSFDIKSGECFGIVGESGCGKTTTGRSIIKLYDITSGAVYYKGYRISAGERWNQKEIKWTKVRCNQAIRKIKNEWKREKAELDPLAALRLHESDAKAEYKKAVKEVPLAAKAEQRKFDLDDPNEKAQFDSINVQIAQKIESLKKEYEDKIVALEEGVAEAAQESKERAEEIKLEQASLTNKYQTRINEELEHCDNICKVQKEKIKQIRFDNANSKKIFKYNENGKKSRLINEIQMIFQDPVDSLDPRMTVEDIIQEGLRIKGYKNREENHKKVVEVLERVGLVAEHASRYPHEFSGGQRQRIGIARALIMDPKLLICDEPISALDVSIRAQVINLLNDLKDELGLTIIFIAHDLSVVKYFCDRIAVMYFGKLVELASSDELFKNPLHPYTRSLLSAIPKPNPLTEKERVRILYNPSTAHDYSLEQPELKEITPGHFVYCNSAEAEEYKKLIK